MAISQTRKFLSPKQAAEEIDSTVSAVMKVIRAKEVKAEKLGWVWMIPVGELPKLRDLVKSRKNSTD